jgi:uncharacterized repeat protein (TIGR03803 family)
MTAHRLRTLHWMSILALALGLYGCGGGNSAPAPAPPPAQTYTLGGTVKGLTGKVVLENSGANSITVATNGAFTFPGSSSNGTAYSVTVGSQPTNQVCTISQGSGMVGNANVTDIGVACVTNTYTIGGAVTGLGSETGLVLTNEGSDATVVPTLAVTFTMNTAVISGTSYAISVRHAPPGIHCDVMNGTGTIDAANVADVQISCGAPLELTFHAFFAGTSDGYTPDGGLVLASDGNFYGTTYSGGSHGTGTVYRVTPAGAETVIYSFAGGPNDGAGPYGEVVQASDGNLYGMTSAGGANGFGTIFRVTLLGAEEVLHSFAGAPTDGRYALNGLVQAGDGNFYGTTQLGGTFNQGTVFKMTPAGTVSVLYSFANASFNDPAIPDATLVVGSNGNLYGTAIGGGTSGYGVVFEITLAGTFTTVYSFLSGTTDGATPEAKLLLASDGNFYGTAPNGGTGSGGVVFKVTPTGQETILHSFGGAPGDGTFPQGNLIEGSDGNFFGTTYSGGANNYGTVYRITPAGVETVLFSFSGVADGQWPLSGLVETPGGQLLGTASAGAGNGAVFELY